MLLDSLPALNIKQFLQCIFSLFCLLIVLLGVLDQKVSERTFQASLERSVAMLLGEAMGLVIRVKRATTIGNNSVQVLFLYTESLFQLGTIYIARILNLELLAAVKFLISFFRSSCLRIN